MPDDCSLHRLSSSSCWRRRLEFTPGSLLPRPFVGYLSATPQSCYLECGHVLDVHIRCHTFAVFFDKSEYPSGHGLKLYLHNREDISGGAEFVYRLWSVRFVTWLRLFFGPPSHNWVSLPLSIPTFSPSFLNEPWGALRVRPSYGGIVVWSTFG